MEQDIERRPVGSVDCGLAKFFLCEDYRARLCYGLRCILGTGA
jgi:hypothetical protein